MTEYYNNPMDDWQNDMVNNTWNDDVLNDEFQQFRHHHHSNNVGGAGGMSASMTPSGKQIHPFLNASLSTAAIALGSLALLTVLIGLMSKCEKGTGKSGPVLVALFIVAISAGCWKLRDELRSGFNILSTLPPFFVGSDGPQVPPELTQWRTWTFNWTIFFVALVGSGIYILETYSIAPLQQNCPPENTEDGSLLQGMLNLREIIYGMVALMLFVPLFVAFRQRQQWSQHLKQAQRLSGDLSDSLSNLPTSQGGYTNSGSTAPFDAAFDVAKLVGFADSPLSQTQLIAAPSATPNVALPQGINPAAF